MMPPRVLASGPKPCGGKNSGDRAELRAPIYQNQTSFPHALSLKRSR